MKFITLTLIILLFEPNLLFAQTEFSRTNKFLSEINHELTQFKRAPSNTLLEQYIHSLNFAIGSSKISLNDAENLIKTTERIISQAPQFNAFAYWTDLWKAVIAGGKGDTADFNRIISQTRMRLQQSGQIDELMNLNMEIANYHLRYNQSGKGIFYYYENEKVFLTIPPTSVSRRIALRAVQNANNLGYYYNKYGPVDSALYFYQQGLTRVKKWNIKEWYGLNSGNLGAVYLKLNRSDSAEILLREDIKHSIENQIYTSAINAYFTICEIYLLKNQFNQAHTELLRAKELFSRFPVDDEAYNKEFAKKYDYTLAQIELGKGNSSTASNLFKRVYELQRNDLSSMKSQSADLVKNRYAYEHNAAELTALNYRSRNTKILILLFAVLLTVAVAVMLVLYRLNTRLKNKNRQIVKQANKLKELNIQKLKLFSLIAVDLRGPVTNLQALLNLHQSKVISNDEFNDYKENLTHSLRNISETLQNLLIWARTGIDQGIRLKVQELELTPLIYDVIELHHAAIKEKRIKLQFKPSKKLVLADELLLSVILRNVFSNAVKFSPIEGSLFISLEKNSPSKTTVWIEDQGQGIKPEKLKKLFTAVDTKDVAKGTSGEKGSGLGLLICKDFAELMKAKVKVESSWGKGTRVGIELKAKNA